MAMEEIPEDIFIEGLKQLVALDKNWVLVRKDPLYILDHYYLLRMNTSV